MLEKERKAPQFDMSQDKLQSVFPAVAACGRVATSSARTVSRKQPVKLRKERAEDGTTALVQPAAGKETAAARGAAAGAAIGGAAWRAAACTAAQRAAAWRLRRRAPSAVSRLPTPKMGGRDALARAVAATVVRVAAAAFGVGGSTATWAVKRPAAGRVSSFVGRTVSRAPPAQNAGDDSRRGCGLGRFVGGHKIGGQWATSAARGCLAASMGHGVRDAPPPQLAMRGAEGTAADAA